VDGETVIDPTIVARLLGLVVEGMSNRAIATRLFVTERTVEAHVTQILLKLGLAESPDQHRPVLTSSRLSRLTLWTTLRAGTGHLPLRN
jgi:DNA-binding NarL/FixJ family response regulator